MTGFFNFKNYALTSILAIVVGFTCGYFVKGEFVKAENFDAAAKAQSQATIDIQQSLNESLAIEKKAAASSRKIDSARAIASQHFLEIESRDAQVLHSVSTDCRPVLDVGTVRLLNDAREGAASDPAIFSDGASQAPSDVGQAELIDNDLQVIGLYHELAIKHDALVDYVESLINKQAEQDGN